ncbi:MAG: hypothetical protein HUJ30_07715 [Gammaproteobacteria bacterium]|nr:hypothetical protein [Gammaproteobacteria bacterium]
MDEHRWIFVIRIIRKPGVLNAVTGVFSSWGISLETAMLNAMGDDGADGIVILSFSCSHRKMEILERTVSRLSRVIELKSYPYATNKLRMIAAFSLNNEQRVLDDKSVEIEEYVRKDKTKTIYVSGTVKDVDSYITPMLKRKELSNLVRTILTA